VMSSRRKSGKRKTPTPKSEITGATENARAGMPPVSATVPPNGGSSVPASRQGATGAAELDSRRLTWPSHVKTIREYVAVLIAAAALAVSIGSCHTARESMGLAQQQDQANRRYHQEHVKPDVRVVVRHSTSPTSKDLPMAAELVILNNGPIKAVSLTGAYRVYLVDPTNSYVIASMGIAEPLVDYSFALSELKSTEQHVKGLLSASSPALYVVNLVYYRETDMEQFSTENYFLFEDGAFYDRESFKGRTNYNVLMDSLLLKMQCEAQAGSNIHRVINPPLPGSSVVNFNVLNVPEQNSPEWVSIMSNWTSKVAADPRNSDVYVERGTCFQLMHKSELAASDYERAIELGSTNFQCYANLATIRSVSTNALLRNGRQALKHARRACELTEWKDWKCIATLAGAFAENGDFASALKYEREALTMPGLLPLEREEAERAISRLLENLPIRE
jgi:tetratricopeptide (TPR) repeat protein